MSTRYFALSGMVLIIGLATVLAGPEKKLLTSCEGCAPKVNVVPDDHPLFDTEMAKLVRLQEAVKSEVLRERFEKFYEDRGTELSPSRASRGAALEFEEEICSWFASNNPQPQERTKLFEVFERSHKCVITGWHGAVQSVEAVKGGRKIQISLSPSLASMKHGVPSTPANCVEDWLATEDGEMRLIKVTVGDRPAFLFSD